jgi:hypothetical protein
MIRLFSNSVADTIVLNNLLIQNSVIGTLLLDYGSILDKTFSNILVKNNIFHRSSSTGDIFGGTVNGNSLIENCVFITGNLSSRYYFHYTSGYVIRNCIFNTETATLNSSSVNNYFYNNVFDGSPNIFNYNNSITLNNQVGINFTTNFVNVPNNSTVFDYSYDFHLATGSPAIGAGTNGSDIGLYGGSESYKEGAVPQAPHIQYKNINTSTTTSGDLPIHIKVKAQEH